MKKCGVLLMLVSLLAGCDSREVDEPIFEGEKIVTESLPEIAIEEGARKFVARWSCVYSFEGKLEDSPSDLSGEGLRFSPIILSPEGEFLSLKTRLKSIEGTPNVRLQFFCEPESSRLVQLEPETIYYSDDAHKMPVWIGIFLPTDNLEEINRKAGEALKKHIEKLDGSARDPEGD